MAYNLERTEQIRELLLYEADVAERKMFGSIGFIVNGKICIGVGDHDDHQMMVRVDPEEYDKILLKVGAAPAIIRGRERKGYVFLSEKAIITDKQLAYWVRLALDYNKKLRPKG